jgi:hypothetical protein
VRGHFRTHIETMKMIIDTKEDCANSMAIGLIRTSNWRRATQAKFPTDPRNGRAADALAKLATEASTLTDEQFAELQPFYNWASQTWHDSLSEATRHVGFQRHINTLAAFVQHLASILRDKRAAA